MNQPAPPAKALSPATLKLRMLKTLVCGHRYERAARRAGAQLIAGVDEVGRGALFGPVVAAAVILPEDFRLRGLRDSKQLTAEDRERMADRIRKRAIAFYIAAVDAVTIDRVNIYQATRIAMCAAVTQLQPTPDHLLIDAMRIDHDCTQTRIIYGDSLSISIAAASVIAKVYRDALIRSLAAEYPHYALASNKGYGSPAHLRGLREHGPCALHRMSFAPVRAAVRPGTHDARFEYEQQSLPLNLEEFLAEE